MGHTSSFKALHNFLAVARAKADPKMGRQVASACKVSFYEKKRRRNDNNNIVKFEKSIGWSRTLTFVARDPAVSFSKKTGIARGPNNGVAHKHCLRGVPISLCNHRMACNYLKAARKSSLLIPYGSLGGGRKVIGK